MPPILRVVVAICATCTLRKLSVAGTWIWGGAILPVSRRSDTQALAHHEVRSLSGVYYSELKYICRRSDRKLVASSRSRG